jgi:hypothetical protein
MRRILEEMQLVDSQTDIVSNTSHMETKWKEIAEGIDHEANETEMGRGGVGGGHLFAYFGFLDNKVPKC